MMRDKLLSAVALCRGAGKLAIGFDAATAALEKGAPMLLIADDAAERTRKNILMKCGCSTVITDLPRTQTQIETVIGRKFAVAAVLDLNFAQLIARALSEIGKEVCL